MFNRIVTHTDLDGVMSAVLLKEVFDIDDVVFTEPADIQSGKFVPEKTDIVCDLPKSGGLWFDHHPGQTPDKDRKCYYNPKAKSAARVIFETYKLEQLGAIVNEVDRIDSATITKESILNPSPMDIISITIRSGDIEKDNEYRLFLINMLSFIEPDQLIKHNIVEDRYNAKKEVWKKDKNEVKKIIKFVGNRIAIIDSVSYGEDYPKFLLYEPYIDHPELLYLITARTSSESTVKIAVGSNIFRKNDNKIDIGAIMSELGGGGHFGIGGADVNLDGYKNVIQAIVDKLK